jgi:hypothetical protein
MKVLFYSIFLLRSSGASLQTSHPTASHIPFTNCSCTPAPAVTGDSLLALLSLLPSIQQSNPGTGISNNHTPPDGFTLSDVMASLSSAGRIGPVTTSVSGIPLQASNNAVPAISRLQAGILQIVLVMSVFVWM